MRLKVPLPPSKVLGYIGFLFLAFLGLDLALYESLPRATSYTWYDAFFWGFVVLWAKQVKVPLPFNASISHLFIIALATVILFPPWVPPLLVFIFAFDRELGSTRYPWYKDLFNRTQNGVATSLAALVYYTFTQVLPISVGGYDLSAGVAISLAAFTFFITNITLVSVVIHLATGATFRKIWVENFGWLALSYLLLAPVSLLLARLYSADPPLLAGWGGFSVLLFLIPLYYSRYHWDEFVKLREAFDSTIELLMKALDAKDPFTRMHSERVTAIAVDLAKAAGIDEIERKKIELGSKIHDIGKIGIPDAVLLKPTRLTEEEFRIIKSHSERGVLLLKPAERYLGEVFPIIKHHHERWDGRGYPDGLAGHEIPLWARIVALADAYEAMTAGRPYQKAKTPEEAMQEILDLAGIQFDPKLARLFHEIWKTDPIWKDREVFLQATASSLPFLEPSAPGDSP